MNILSKFIQRLHADLLYEIGSLDNNIQDRIQSFSREMQCKIQGEKEELEDKIETQDKQLRELMNKVEQQTVIIGELQSQIVELGNEAKKQTELAEKNIADFDRVNSTLTQMISSILGLLNSMMPYFPLLRSNCEEVVANVNSIYSFCLNEAIKKQINIDETKIFQYYKRLHDLTACHEILEGTVEKCRVGRAHDGGYVMIRPFSAQKIAYSIGICDDVSWDKEMADYGYSIYQYDHTIEKLPEENEAFHWQKVGLTGLEETDELKRLDTIIRENGHDKYDGMVLKMDIEGYEWDLLNTCNSGTLKQFDQIVMEIHSLNDVCNFDKIITGLEKLTATHAVVHVHGNNYRYASFCGEMITPDVLEITLVKKSLYNLQVQSNVCTDIIDQVNRPNSQDIWMGKW